MKIKSLPVQSMLLLGLLLICHGVYSQRKVVVGYIPGWTNMQNVVDNTDFTIVTHINISFINPNSAGNFVSGGQPVCSEASTTEINYVVNRAHQNGAKVLASLGGGSVPACSGNWATLLQPANRTRIVNNLVALCNTYGLDGIDVDIEGSLLTTIMNAGNYTPFIQALRTALNPSGRLVTCASAAYNGGMIPSSSFPYFHLVNIMSYDTGWGSPGNHSTYANAVAHVQKFITAGCPANKLVLGVPFYGYSGAVGSGYSAFKTIVAQYPQAAYVDSYAGFEYNGITTIENKTTYAAQNIAGVMIWELSQDASGSLSLLKAIGRKLGSTGGTNTMNTPAQNGNYNLQSDVSFSFTVTSQVSRILIYYSTGWIDIATLSSPFTYKWFPPSTGAQVVHFEFYDANWNYISGGSRNINITSSSKVNFTKPAENSTATGEIHINAVASDPTVGTADGAGILKVNFELIRGASVVASRLENGAPYDWYLNTAGYADGAYFLKATATSTAAAGNDVNAVSIPVTISNGALLTTATEKQEKSIPVSVYPVPATSSATIEFSVRQETEVELTILSSDGDPVKSFEKKIVKPGKLKYEWNVGSIGKGLYVYRLRTGEITTTGKILVE